MSIVNYPLEIVAEIIRDSVPSMKGREMWLIYGILFTTIEADAEI